MKHFAVFGTHPRLSLAEFRQISGDSTPQPLLIGSAALSEDPAWDGAVLMNRLGGTVKVGDIHDECTLDDLNAGRIVKMIERLPREDRIVFGLTVYGGTPAGKRAMERLPLEIKRELKTRGKSARWVTSENDQPLSPAAVAKLNLTTEGYDLAIFVHGTNVSIGLTTHVQDADAWSLRDYGRPVRDDENGMLPPKLARMMVNLARIPEHGTLLDPFCGSGTVMMEAALATHADMIVMSDIEATQVESARRNLNWLIERRVLREDDRARIAFATSDAKTIARHVNGKVDAIVTEGYLGPPLKGNETQAKLDKIVDDIASLWRDSLAAFHPLLKPNGRVVCVWPAMKTSHGTARVDLTQDLSRLGFRTVNPLERWDDSNAPLLYHRAGQRIMRRIVVLKRDTQS
jgi:tRNA G10  N-methylase Trm11